jgi:amidohydrolase
MENSVRKYRRDLHQIPELGFDVLKTKDYIVKVLQQYRCKITEVCGTGICAFFQSEQKQNQGGFMETVAFRSDMDALPIVEQTNAPYCSCHEGKMHACGHDGHMAMLLALAGELNERIESLSCNVLLIFQPAEETTGGAGDICATGILSDYSVKKIYGIHLWPMIKKHAIASRPGEFMAKSSEIDIEIRGKSAHCAEAEEGIDALWIGCKLLNDLYEMVQNELAKQAFCLLKFGKLTSGTVRNAISDRTELQGTLRCFDMETFHYVLKRMDEIAANYEQKYLCSITVKHTEGYPPVINDPNLFEESRKALQEFDFTIFEKPFMLAEDFSFYQQKVPGLFLFLGTGTSIPLHNNKFDFDEEILETGVQVYLKLLELERK